jgi:hypothetical protein
VVVVVVVAGGEVAGVVVAGGEVAGVVVAGGDVTVVVVAGGDVTVVLARAVVLVVVGDDFALVDDVPDVGEVVGIVVGVVAAGMEACAGFVISTTDHLPQVSVTFPFACPVEVSPENR